MWEKFSITHFFQSNGHASLPLPLSLSLSRNKEISPKSLYYKLKDNQHSISYPQRDEKYVGIYIFEIERRDDIFLAIFIENL